MWFNKKENFTIKKYLKKCKTQALSCVASLTPILSYQNIHSSKCLNTETTGELDPMGRKALSNEPPLVSIVIVNYNGSRFLKDCLSSLLKTKYSNFEIILVDNCSTDDSIDVTTKILRDYPHHKIIRNKKN